MRWLHPRKKEAAMLTDDDISRLVSEPWAREAGKAGRLGPFEPTSSIQMSLSWSVAAINTIFLECQIELSPAILTLAPCAEWGPSRLLRTYCPSLVYRMDTLYPPNKVYSA